MCNHASDGLVEDAGWSTEVERTTGLVEAGGLSEVSMIFDFMEHPVSKSPLTSVASVLRYVLSRLSRAHSPSRSSGRCK